MPYRSRAQQGKFFADPRLRKYARKWAHETGEHHGQKGSKAAYAKLPKYVKGSEAAKAKKRRKKTGSSR